MLCVYLMFSHGLTVLFAQVSRWLTDDDKYKYDCCIPIETPAQRGLTRIYLEALCSGFCGWSVCQLHIEWLYAQTSFPYDASQWTRTEHTVTVNSTLKFTAKEANLLALISQKWINIPQYYSILH